MNIINIEHISKIFGEKTIFEDASFGILEGDKIGIVGINGTGKTTLLKMIAGIEEPDDGKIIRQNNLKIAYLTQNPQFPEDATVADFALSDSPDRSWRVQSNLMELGITEFSALLGQLSGGQRRKVAMAKLLASDFDVLLLDEPANHLDGAMIAWLEGYPELSGIADGRGFFGERGKRKAESGKRTAAPSKTEEKKSELKPWKTSQTKHKFSYREQREKELEEKMDRWVYLNDLAEQIEAEKENKK